MASDLLDFLMSREDSEPFRMPVDTDRYPVAMLFLFSFCFYFLVKVAL